MNKYTRYTTIVTSIIKDIFDSNNISLDTKAIVLVLAATMETNRYIHLITSLDQLSFICAKLIEVNALRWKHGNIIRDCIVAQVIQRCDTEISSDELQQFMTSRSSVMKHKKGAQLTPALHIDQLKLDNKWQQKVNAEVFAAAKNKATNYLVNKLSTDCNNDKNIIAEAFIHCRCNQQPLVVYYAVIHAMADILIASGLDAKYALIYSYKLAKHGLEIFMHSNDHPKTILHAYKS